MEQRVTQKSGPVEVESMSYFDFDRDVERGWMPQNDSRPEPAESSKEDEETPSETREKTTDTEDLSSELPRPSHWEAIATPRNRSTQSSRSRSRRRSIPVGFTAGFGEGNLGRQVELELQRTKSLHNVEQGKNDDPNLVEWSGPDDPGNPMNWPAWKK